MSSISGASNNFSGAERVISFYAARVSSTTGGESASSCRPTESSCAPAKTAGSGQDGAFFAELRSQIETAVTNVLKEFGVEPQVEDEAQTGDTGQTSAMDSIDPAQLFAQIHAAMDSVLRENGIEPPARPEREGDGPPPMGRAGDKRSSPMRELLEKNGVDPEEFRQSFLKALQQASDGNVDFSQIFQAFPPGQSLDLEA